MASKSQKKSASVAAQSLTSPALKQTLMANAICAMHPLDSPTPTQQPEDNALLQLVKAEMGTSRQLLSDIFKQKTACFCAEIKWDLESLRQDTKADISSLKMEFRVELESLRSARTETATTAREMEGEESMADTCSFIQECAVF